MKKTFRKILSFVLVFTLLTALMSVMAPTATIETEAATTITKADIQKIKDKIAANEKKIKDTTSKINTLSADINNYLATVEQIQIKIDNLESNINDTKELITKYETLISETKIEIFERENQINAKYDDFLEIIKRTYEDGNQSYLEILFDSNGLSDFLSRVDRLGSIISYEQTVLAELEKEIADLKNLNLTLEQAKKETVTLGSDQKEAEAELLAAKKKAEDELKKLNSDKKALEAVKKQANELDKKLDKELEATIKKYDDQQAAAANAKLLWPVEPRCKTISSPYGPRSMYGRNFHYGIDIVGGSSGSIKNTNIYASDNGKVIISTYNSSYGNYVVIDHGNSISTVYAHMAKRLVDVGDTVKRGEVIGKVGTTGQSTGYHLHFEVRVNGVKTDPLYKNGSKTESWFVIKQGNNYVDPITKKLLTIYDN